MFCVHNRKDEAWARGKRPKEADFKAIWEISEEVVLDYCYEFTHIGGGRGKDPKITWEEAYLTLMRNIC